MKVTALKIEFEAFGKIHIAYTHTWNHGAIQPALSELGDTTHIRSISTDLIDQDLFEAQNIERLEEWNTEIRQKIAA